MFVASLVADIIRVRTCKYKPFLYNRLIRSALKIPYGLRLFTGNVVFARFAIKISRQSEVIQLLGGFQVGTEAY